jgi:hypothetical protein
MGDLHSPSAAHLDKCLEAAFDLGLGHGHRSPSAKSYSLRFKKY